MLRTSPQPLISLPRGRRRGSRQVPPRTPAIAPLVGGSTSNATGWRELPLNVPVNALPQTFFLPIEYAKTVVGCGGEARCAGRSFYQPHSLESDTG